MLNNPASFGNKKSGHKKAEGKVAEEVDSLQEAYMFWVKSKMAPSEFWGLTVTEWWWWFESMIPEHITTRSELCEKLKQAKIRYKNNES